MGFERKRGGLYLNGLNGVLDLEETTFWREGVNATVVL